MGRILALGGRARYIVSVYQKIDVLWVPSLITKTKIDDTEGKTNAHRQYSANVK